ncbi:hypothetical protein ONZ43_g1865 [Nemania bipapillata]|uniref:Uncharacterized protein n=1 Tax=Nemania bipapillata TaxID=110536 RepID=A0ACC2J2S2_9PEZI|nr:hypothetical protein ONZ43_g1865 [Nemania bipapillata]
MAQPQHPESYTTYTALPEISFQHVPETSPTATPVIILRLDRPKANNAFTDTMMTSLVSAFNLLSTDARVKAIVFTGADPRNRVFCPGMDLDQASNSSTTTSGAKKTKPPSPRRAQHTATAGRR